MNKVPLIITVETFRGEKGLLVQTIEDVEALVEAE